jgi:hypothetical protein
VLADSVATYDEWSLAAREVLQFRPNGMDFVSHMQSPPVTQEMGYFVATDPRGSPVAFSLVAIFNECAVLICSVSLAHHPAASSSRYLLHTFMRSDLRARGVRYLIAGSAVTESPGLQYFQYLLGYEVYNLRISVGGGPPSAPIAPGKSLPIPAGAFV